MTELPKFLAKRVAGYAYPMLMIMKEKHDTWYLLIADEAALWRACIQVIKHRVEIKYIQEPRNEPYGIQEEVAEELWDRLTPNLKTQAMAVRAANQRSQAIHAEEIDHWKLAQTALSGDGHAAYMVLMDRKDCEYEGVELRRIAQA